LLGDIDRKGGWEVLWEVNLLFAELTTVIRRTITLSVRTASSMVVASYFGRAESFTSLPIDTFVSSGKARKHDEREPMNPRTEPK
jgi:hypothetical protein